MAEGPGTVRVDSTSTHYEVGMGGVLIGGPEATAYLSVHEDSDGVIGLDIQFWEASENPPKTVDEAEERLDEIEGSGGFYWGMSASSWKVHSKEVSGIIGRKVTLEEGGGKTDWRRNNRVAKAGGIFHMKEE
jgi:hypothetical protein